MKVFYLANTIYSPAGMERVLITYNAEGLLEERRYLNARQFTVENGIIPVKTTILTDVAYDIFVAANVGYALPALSREAAEAYRYYFAYPDEYRRACSSSSRAFLRASPPPTSSPASRVTR